MAYFIMSIGITINYTITLYKLVYFYFNPHPIPSPKRRGAMAYFIMSNGMNIIESLKYCFFLQWFIKNKKGCSLLNSPFFDLVFYRIFYLLTVKRLVSM